MYAKNHYFEWLYLKFHPILTAYQSLRIVKLSSKNFDVTNQLRDNKYNYMPKIILIGWDWNSALSWQIYNYYELSSYPKIHWPLQKYKRLKWYTCGTFFPTFCKMLFAHVVLLARVQSYTDKDMSSLSDPFLA